MASKPTKATEGKAAAKGSKRKLNTLTIKDLSAPDERASKIKGGANDVFMYGMGIAKSGPAKSTTG